MTMMEDTMAHNKLKFSDRFALVHACLIKLAKMKTSPDSIQRLRLVSNMIRPALEVVLNANYIKLPDKAREEFLVACIESSLIDICSNTNILEVIRAPWEKQILMKIMNNAPDLTIQEVNDFICTESDIILRIRFKNLIENRCISFAKNLCKWIFTCITSEECSARSVIRKPFQQFFIHNHISMLYKSKRTMDTVVALQALDINEGIEMIKRVHSRPQRKLTELIINVLLAKIVIKPYDKTSDNFTYLINELLVFYPFCCDTLIQTIRKLCAVCESSDHIVEIARCLTLQVNKTSDKALKRFIMELYVRALTTDANDLDNAKHIRKDMSIVKKTGKKLSRIFELMVHQVDNETVKREFIMNAFAVDPRIDLLEEMEKMAKRLEQQLVEINCDRHKPISGPSLCSKCGFFIMSSTADKTCSDSMLQIITPDMIDLSNDLRDDLNVVLTNTRFQGLTWRRDWSSLRAICQDYVENFEDSVLDVDLDYVNIDYSMFDNWERKDDTDNMYSGIERGYEHYVEESDDSGIVKIGSGTGSQAISAESDLESLGSDGAGEKENPPVNMTEKSSDPSVLRTLRAFRPILKRHDRAKEDYGPVLKMIREREPKNRPLDLYNKSYKVPLRDINTRSLTDFPNLGGNESGCENISDSILNKVARLKEAPRKRKSTDHSDNDSDHENNCKKLMLNHLNGLDMIRPAPAHTVVHVVQIAQQSGQQPAGQTGPTASTPLPSAVSTPVTAHIQRVGQPTPIAKTNRENAETTNPQQSVIVSTSPAGGSQTSEHSVVAGSQVLSRARPPVINILSNEMIRPASSRSTSKVTASSTPVTETVTSTEVTPPVAKPSTLTQLLNQSTTKVIPTTTAPQQIILNPQLLKSVSDGTKPVQFVYKIAAGGKTLQLTPVPTVGSIRVQSTTDPKGATTAPRSTYEENYAKFIQSGGQIEKPADQLECGPALPKFQQAFGKTGAAFLTTSALKVGTTGNTSVTGDNVTSVVRLVPVTTVEKEMESESDSSRETSTPTVNATATIGKSSTVLTPMRLTFPLVNRATTSNVPTTRVVTPLLVRHQRVVLAPAAARITQNRITPEVAVVDSSVSSSTLEQLREFDKVMEKVKERSSVGSSGSIADEEVEFKPTNGSGNTTVTATLENVQTNLQPQQIGVTYVGQGLVSTCAPVVLVNTFSSLSSSSSPALTVATQAGTNSTVTVTSATVTTGLSKILNIKTNVSTSPAKSPKSKTVKSTSTSASKTSPLPKIQQKPQEDEGTAQRIYSILAEYAEQLRNSPDLNNKPAPRRRSNPPTNPSQSGKRKKTSGSSGKKPPGTAEMSPGTADDHRTMGSEDSSSGIVQVSLQNSPSGQSMADDTQSLQSNADVVISDYTERISQTTTRQLIFAETNANSAHGHRNVIIADSSVGEALAQVGKITNTAAVLVPGNYILPMSVVKGGHQITIVSGGSKILAVKPLKLPTVPVTQTTVQSMQNTQVVLPEVTTNLNVKVSESGVSLTRNFGTHISVINEAISTTPVSDAISEMSEPEQQSICSETTEDVQQSELKPKSITPPVPDSIQTDLDTVNGVANGPMLSDSCNTEDMMQNGNDTTVEEEIKKDVKKVWSGDDETLLRHSPGMQYGGESVQPLARVLEAPKKRFGANSAGATSTDSKLDKIRANTSAGIAILQAQRKQAALEREFRLQKSLSEECEDLGVDEPSTSDLFPDAHLLFDSNHSPLADNSSQDTASSSANQIYSDLVSDKLSENKDMDDISQDSDYFFDREGLSVKNGTLGSKDLSDHSSPPSTSKLCDSPAALITYSKKSRAKLETKKKSAAMLLETDSDMWSLSSADSDSRASTGTGGRCAADVCVSRDEEASPSVRRASARGHVKKGCSCCVGSPPPAKKRILSVKKLRSSPASVKKVS